MFSVNEEIPWKCKVKLRYLVNVCFPRLNDPTQCPANGSRREDCDCRRDYSAAGITTFSKVRLDLSKMNIISKLPTVSQHPVQNVNSTLLQNENFLWHLIMFMLTRVNGLKMSLRSI